MSEDAQIRSVLSKMEVVKVSDLLPGQSKFVVGRVCLTKDFITAPVSGRQCVYYEVHCEREESHKNPETGEVTKFWVPCFNETKQTDFIIADGSGKSAFVPGSTSKMKMYAMEDSQGQEQHTRMSWTPHSSTQSDRNPHLKAMLQRHGALSYANIRYREGCFTPNETIAILGTATASTLSGNSVMMLSPVVSSVLTEEYFEKNEWSGLERKCWENLTETPCIIGTDDPKYMKGIVIPPLEMGYNSHPLALPIAVVPMARPMYGAAPNQVIPVNMPQQPMGMQQQGMYGQQPMGMQMQQPMGMQMQQPMGMQMQQQPMVQPQGMYGVQPTQQQPMMQQPMGMQMQQPIGMQMQQQPMMQQPMGMHMSQQPMMQQPMGMQMQQQPMGMQMQQPMGMQMQQPIGMQMQQQGMYGQ
jgi:hypothetical protein